MMVKINKKYVTGTFLMGSVMAANILNLIFNIFLGRFISITEFGVIILMTNFIYVGGMLLNALASTLNHEVALNSKADDNSIKLIRNIFKNILKITLPLSAAWIILSPFFSHYFHVPNVWVFFLFTPVIFVYPYLIGGRGYFQGRFAFLTASLIMISEPVLKLTTAAILLLLGLHEFIYTSIYISSLLAGILSIILILRIKPSTATAHHKFPKKFFFSALLAGAASMAFLSLDVILAKHYLNPIMAGQYALLSLVGKMVYFLGTLLNIFTISLISRDLGHKKSTRISFYLLFGGSIFLCIFGFTVFGLLKDFTLPFLFGKKSIAILPFLNSYIIAMILFTLSSILVAYHLAKKQFIFPILSIMSAPLLLIGIFLFHSNIESIINVLLTVSTLTFSVLLFLHIKKDEFNALDINKFETYEEVQV